MTKEIFLLLSIGDRIRWLRERKGINQLELANLIGISGPSVSNLETGRSKRPASTTLLRLAAALDANPGWIVTGKGDPFDWPTFTDGDEADLIAIFKSLSNEQKGMLMAVANTLKP